MSASETKITSHVAQWNLYVVVQFPNGLMPSRRGRTQWQESNSQRFQQTCNCHVKMGFKRGNKSIIIRQSSFINMRGTYAKCATYATGAKCLCVERRLCRGPSTNLSPRKSTLVCHHQETGRPPALVRVVVTSPEHVVRPRDRRRTLMDEHHLGNQLWLHLFIVSFCSFFFARTCLA